MISFAHDINLNFPAFDPSWSDFFGESHCTPRAYFDLKRLTDDLLAGKPTAAYLPAANDYFLRADKGYRGIRDVGAWQKQIDAVLAGTVDATMVDADTYASLPENAAKTRVLDEVDQLPTPVVIARSDAPASFVDELKQNLLSEPRDEDELFSGFIDYEETIDERFF